MYDFTLDSGHKIEICQKNKKWDVNANLKAASDGFVDKSLLKCLVVNDNVNNVYLMTSLIYVTL